MLGLGRRHDVLAASLRLSRACPEGSAIGSRRCVRDQPLLRAVWLSSSGFHRLAFIVWREGSPRQIVAFGAIAVRAGRRRGMRALPWPLGMVLADPSAIITEIPFMPSLVPEADSLSTDYVNDNRVGGLLSARRAKRIDDAQAFAQRHPVLHVLRPQRIAACVKRRGCDHGVVGGKAVPLGEPQSGLVNLDGQRMNRQQTAQHVQKCMRVRPRQPHFRRATLVNSLRTCMLIAPPAARAASARSAFIASSDAM